MDDKGKTPVQGVPAKKIISPSGKHLLPRLPTFSGPTRIAQSKASAKECAADDMVINLVPAIEAQKEIAEEQPTLGIKPREMSESEPAGKTEQVSADEIISKPESSKPSTDEEIEKEILDEAVEEATPTMRRFCRSTIIKNGASKNDSGDGTTSSAEKHNDTNAQVPEKLPGDPDPSTVSHKRKKENRNKLSEEELMNPSTWLVGDLVWSKVTGHAWWPCMISYDPILGVHTQLKMSGRALQRSYHVQYFGARAERGWSREAAVIEFKGMDAFEEQMKGRPPVGKYRNKNIYDLAAAKKAIWEFAVGEAVKAMAMTRDDRKSKLTFQYRPPKEKSSSVSSAGTASPEHCPKEKKARKSTGSVSTKIKDVARGGADLINGLLLGKKKRLSEPVKKPKSVREVGSSSDVVVSSGFDVYYEKNAKKVQEDHPTFTEDAVKQYLQHHWIGLSTDQKQEYEGTVILEDQGGRRLSARVKKPSKKVLEAVEDLTAEEVQEEKEPPTKKKKSPPKPERPRVVGDTLDDTINCLLYGDDYNKVEYIEEGSVEKKEKVKKPAAIGKPVEAKKVAGVRKVPKTKKVPKNKVLKKEEKRGRKRKSPEPLVTETETTDLDSQAEVLVTPPVKRRRTKDDGSSSSDGEKGSVIKDEVSDTDSLMGKKPRKRTKVDATESESDITEYDTIDEDINKPGAFTYKPGKVCQICEEPENLIQCESSCMRSFHPACLGMTEAPTAEFKCDECLSGVHTCFICKQTDKETRRCSIGMCGKFYHEDCLKRSPLSRIDGKTFICPLHVCATCYADNPKSLKANKGRLVRCVRCPTAYHTNHGDQCIAAGCDQLTTCNLICSKHFKPEKYKGHHAHVNVSWCFSCSKGGTLLCCESCPAAFHIECLGIQSPEGSWYCDQCEAGKRPLYNDIVWVKLGNYRWWPARICHPRNVPKNIQEKKHQVGEFPVHFFGSKDYFWTHQGRVFLFQDGDKGSRESANTKRLEEVFKTAVLEATEAFQNWKKIKENKLRQDTLRTEKKPPPYKYIKVNVPVGNVQVYKADVSTIPRCECTEEMACASGSGCLNRILMYECHPSHCPAGEKCQNQRFQKRQYPEAVPYKTPGRGWGLKCRFDIKKGEFVNEYVGELIDEEECKLRIKHAHDDNVSSFYLLTLDSKRVIDAGPKGNLSRFMNHSCEPNCVTQKWNVNGDVRVGLFATCDIPAGTELTFNYNLDCLGNDKMVCKCGAPRCSGFLGVPPKVSRVVGKDDPKKKKKKKRKWSHRPKHEDDCYRCGEGGTLVMCDLPGCTKAYHMGCLTLDKLPYGKWICPWHHCDVCGKKAVRKCDECPNSFCTAHAEGHITVMGDGKLFCDDHKELIETYATMGSSPSSTSSEAEAETNGDDTAGENAKMDQPMEAADSPDIAHSDTAVGEEESISTKNLSSNGNDSNDGEGKKRARGRPKKKKRINAESTTVQKEKPKKAVKKTEMKAVNSDKTYIGHQRKSQKLKANKVKRAKKLKKSNGKEKKGGATLENNNELKHIDQDAATTDDDDFPSLVIDIPGC